MNDLVSKQDVFNEIRKVSGYLDKHMIIGLYIGLNMLPSAQPERELGEWVAYGDIPKECPFCGEDWDKYVFGDVDYTGDLPKFCPNCGADMRGKKNG